MNSLKKEIGTNRIISKTFQFNRSSEISKSVYNMNNKNKNSHLINVIKSGLSDLKKEIEKMGEDEKRIEELDKMVNIVVKIILFNIQNQQGQGLKILTPDQMLKRLPISLAQVKAENNSENLKNKIIQLLYSLYRSKQLTKIIYSNLINTTYKRKKS